MLSAPMPIGDKNILDHDVLSMKRRLESEEADNKRVWQRTVEFFILVLIRTTLIFAIYRPPSAFFCK
jgi:hypothetical protein